MNIRYSLYEFEFNESDKTKNGLLISRNKYLQEDDRVQLYQIGNKMYYAITP